MKEFRFSAHAAAQSERRGLGHEAVERVLESPDQRVPAFGGRTAYQSRTREDNIEYLLRVIVDERVSPAVVVTVYRTSRIDKYWRKP